MPRPLYRHPGAPAARLEVTVPNEPEPADEIAVVRWLEQMRADLAESLGGVMLRSARPVTLTVLPTQVSASPGRLVGWSIRETSGDNPFVIRFHNGDNPTADLVGMATGGAGATDTRWLGPGGVSFTEGLRVELVTGASLSAAVEGVLYLGAAD